MFIYFVFCFFTNLEIISICEFFQNNLRDIGQCSPAYAHAQGRSRQYHITLLTQEPSYITCNRQVFCLRRFGVRRWRRMYLRRERWQIGKQRSVQVCIGLEVGDDTPDKSLAFPLVFLSRAQWSSLFSLHVHSISCASAKRWTVVIPPTNDWEKKMRTCFTSKGAVSSHVSPRLTMLWQMGVEGNDMCVSELKLYRYFLDINTHVL